MLNSYELNELGSAIWEAARIVRSAYAAPDVDISLQDGPVAGQTIDHLHIHLIPRGGEIDLPDDADWSESITGRREPPSEVRPTLSEDEFVSVFGRLKASR